MAKAVLLSIHPVWVEEIAKGRKTVEIRKSRPNLNVPFKCYIYCTNMRPLLAIADVFRGDWETEVTQICGYNRAEAEKIWDIFNGRVVGEFACTKVDRLVHIGYTRTREPYQYKICSSTSIKDAKQCFKAACLTEKDVEEYLQGRVGYGWHISNLQIYDKPLELGKFMKAARDCRYADVAYLGPKCECCREGECMVQRPPQSWCYVEELENG